MTWLCQQQRIGGQINQTGQAVTSMAATPYAVGQQLLNEPIDDPNTQQQMMRAGLTSAAGSLGAASLGSWMAGSSRRSPSAGPVSPLSRYGRKAMRGEAMSDIGQAASIAGQGGQLQGLGASTINQAGQTSGLGCSKLPGWHSSQDRSRRSDRAGQAALR